MLYSWITGFFQMRADSNDEVVNEPKNLVLEQNMSLTSNRGTMFLASSLAAWPAFWLLRGLDWKARRGKEPLNFYIQRTFYQAKLLQMLILTGGFILALSFDDSMRTMPVNEQQENYISTDVFDSFP